MVVSLSLLCSALYFSVSGVQDGFLLSVESGTAFCRGNKITQIKQKDHISIGNRKTTHFLRGQTRGLAIWRRMNSASTSQASHSFHLAGAWIPSVTPSHFALQQTLFLNCISQLIEYIPIKNNTYTALTRGPDQPDGAHHCESSSSCFSACVYACVHAKCASHSPFDFARLRQNYSDA